MKQAIRMAFLASVAGVLTGCPNGPGGPGVSATTLKTSDFVVAIEQDGERVALADREARLKRGPFTVVLVIPRWSGVMVNASHTDGLARAVAAGRPVSTVLPLPKQALPEDMANPRKCVFVSDEQYNHWYYFGDASNSFDSVFHAPREFVCRREIANLAADKDSPLSPISRIPPPGALYLTFVATKWAQPNRIQTSAEYVKLVFE